MDLHAKKQSDVYIAEDTMISNSIEPFKVQKAGFTARAVLSHGQLNHHKPIENKVSEKYCSVEHVKKKKHKKKQSRVAVQDDGDKACREITQNHCSSSKVMKPDVKLKFAAKCVKDAKICSDSVSSSLSPVPDEVCKSSSLDSSMPIKGKKRKRRCSEVDTTAKTKKSRAADSKSDEVHVVSGKCSAGPVNCNFNVVQLRSALQQYGRLSDAVLQQDRLCDKGRTARIDQKTATVSTKCEQVDTNVSETNNNSLPSKTASAGNLSGLLKERMKNRLTSARFRFVNEQMYNSTGAEAAEMFAHDKDAFSIYHAGFQSQVSKWPVNPVDKMIDYINSRLVSCCVLTTY